MKKRLEAAIRKSAKAVGGMDFRNQALYETWLAQTYFFVRHSTPMLALSCGLAIENRPYHLRCISHLAEEKGHDRLLINDLKALGSSIDLFEELSSTRAFYQTQYYWIEHVNPVSFLGYVLLLEGIAVSCGAEKIKETEGFSGRSFVEVHAKEDLAHLGRAMAQIEAMSEKDRRDIVSNAEQSSDLYELMMAEIARSPIRGTNGGTKLKVA